jgi:hypothetical protein
VDVHPNKGLTPEIRRYDVNCRDWIARCNSLESFRDFWRGEWMKLKGLIEFVHEGSKANIST